jgi:hypothetical protein
MIAHDSNCPAPNGFGCGCDELILIDKVIEQIKRDIDNCDETAIVELLLATPRDKLESFLPENVPEKLKAFIPLGELK